MSDLRLPELLEARRLLTSTPQLIAEVQSTPSGDLSGSFVSHDTLYFHASSEETGRELWRSDGTSGGTRLIHDFEPGSDGATTRIWGDVGEQRLFHSERPLGLSGRLYALGPDSGEPLLLSADVTKHVGGNERIHFFLTSNRELWATDGTATGTVAVYSQSSVFEAVYSKDRGVLVRAEGMGLGHVSESRATTTFFDDWAAYDISTVFGETMYETIHGWLIYGGDLMGKSGIWFTDDTAANMELAVSSSAQVQIFGDSQGRLAFGSGLDFWETDGTVDGTLDRSRYVFRFLGASSAGFFYAGRNDGRLELVTFRGMEPLPETVAELSGANAHFVANVSEDRFLFRTIGGGEEPQLWISDGTSDGTTSLPVVFDNSRLEITSDPASQWFAIKSMTDGVEAVWVSDGTAENTSLLVSAETLADTELDSVPVPQAVVGSVVLLKETEEDGSEVLWEARLGRDEVRRVQSAVQFGEVHAVDQVLRYLVGDDASVGLWQLELKVSGDTNGDGLVNFADFLVLSSNFGNEVTVNEGGDLDGNGFVSFADFLLLSAEF